MFKSIISPAELQFLLDSEQAPLVFACHHDLSDPEAGRRRWQGNRIETAGFLHLDEDLSGPILPGQTGRHPLPTKEHFLAAIQAQGYSGPQQQVIVYDSKGGGIAARAWWMFNWIGHEAVAVLDGGLPAYERWREQAELAQPAYSSENAEPTATSSPADPQARQALVQDTFPAPAMRDEIDTLARNEDRVVIDSRTAPRYRGEQEPIDPVAGHIPGAINLPWPDNLDENGRFKSREELKKRFTPLRSEASENVFYCGSGVTACHNILAYYHAFGAWPRLYPGSWSEYLIAL